MQCLQRHARRDDIALLRVAAQLHKALHEVGCCDPAITKRIKEVEASRWIEYVHIEVIEEHLHLAVLHDPCEKLGVQVKRVFGYLVGQILDSFADCPQLVAHPCGLVLALELALLVAEPQARDRRVDEDRSDNVEASESDDDAAHHKRNVEWPTESAAESDGNGFSLGGAEVAKHKAECGEHGLLHRAEELLAIQNVDLANGVVKAELVVAPTAFANPVLILHRAKHVPKHDACREDHHAQEHEHIDQ
mmetsp:Transcript_88436/g.255168  ORF Transcript_88436/g.255168 Transcript_88436/m.255168 type:complete len:248 (-) Transcript_88436:1034-1777(-)